MSLWLDGSACHESCSELGDQAQHTLNLKGLARDGIDPLAIYECLRLEKGGVGNLAWHQHLTSMLRTQLVQSSGLELLTLGTTCCKVYLRDMVPQSK